MSRASGGALRQKILQEAIGIVYREGEERVTMRALAEALGYSPATIYLHFRNKQELIREIGRFGFLRLHESVRPAVDLPDPLTAVRESMRAYSEFGFEHPQLYRLMFQDLEAEPTPEEEQLAQTYVGLFKRGVESGAFRPMDPLEAALKTWALFHGFVQLAISRRVPPLAELPGVVKPTLAGLRDALLAGLEHDLKPC